MSLGSIMDSSRLGRAKKISMNKVKEFEITSDNPLIAFLLIQGSSRTPYVVILDTAKRLVYHSCPDFKKSSVKFCKHVGKLFLLLLDDQIDLDIKLLKKFKKKTTAIDKKLGEVRMTKVKDNLDTDTSSEFSLEVGMTLLFKEPDNSSLASKVGNKLNKELDIDDDFIYLSTLYNIQSSLSNRDLKVFIKIFGDQLKIPVLERVKRFTDKMATRDLIRNLELAYLLANICRTLKIELPEYASTNNNDSSRIKENRDLNYKILGQFSKQGQKTDTTLKNAYIRVIRMMSYRGSRLPELNNYLQKQVGKITNYITVNSYVDNFLIYLLQNNGEKIEYKLYWKNDVARFPVKLIEGYPAFIYALNGIKESERDYLTFNEYKNHKTFFNFIERGKKSGEWVEKPRIRDEGLLDINGSIIQWEMNISQLHDDMFHVEEGNTRLVVNKSSIIYNQIQPFDYTLNEVQRRPISNYTEEVIPKNLLVPNQVIELVFQGVKITSNVLPWHVLYEFATSGNLNRGDVSLAIHRCRENQFAFGSYDLKGAFERLLTMGRSGISEKKYSKIHSVLKDSTGRLNTETRPLIKDLTISEGENLDNLLNIITDDPTEIQKFILNVCRKSSDIGLFRRNCISECINRIKRMKELNINFDKIIDLELGLYHAFKTQLRDYLLNEVETIISLFDKSEEKGMNKLRRHQLGEIILSKYNLDIKSSTSANDIDKIKEMLGEMLDYR